MPRDAGGTYTLPGGNPVVSGTVIETSWANPTMADLANGLTDSLSRTGNGGMLVPFRVPNGAVGSPSLSFLNNILSGLYLFDTGDVRMTINGADLTRFSGGKTQEWSGSEWLNLYQTAALVPYDPSGSQLTGTDVQAALTEAAPVVSPAFTGTPTAPTPALGDDSTKLATTAFVEVAIDAVNPHRLFLGNTTNPLVDLKLQNQIDFTGSGAVTFTRASTATYIDRYGVVQTAAVDEPRFEAEGLLMEGASTNLLLRSEEFDNAAWTKTNTSVTPNSTTAPDGTTTADTLASDGGTFPGSSQSFTLGAGSYTISVFFKEGSSPKPAIRIAGTNLGGSASNAVTWRYVFATDSFESGGEGGSATVETASKILDNGWVKVSMTMTADTVTSAAVYPFFNEAFGTANVFAWGAQLEQLPFATSYIKTTSATVARARDDFPIPPANNIGIGDTTIVIDFSLISPSGVSGAVIFSADNIQGNNDAELRVLGRGNSGIIAISLGGVVINTNVTGIANTPYRVVAMITASRQVVYVNGVEALVSTATYNPTNYLRMRIGNYDNSLTVPTTGHIPRLQIFDRALTDYEMGIV